METVTNLIRAIANDMIYSSAGEILTDTANFMLPLLNDALEWFTNEVNNHGVDTFTKETLLTPLTATTNPNPTDPALQTSISDTGYFDGYAMLIGPQLQLPPDLLNPIFLWERKTGSTDNFVPMAEKADGLPSVTPGDRFKMWDWRQDGIYMPACVQSNDIRLRYKGSLASFVSTDDTLYFRGACGPIAYKMVSTFLISKNPESAQMAASEALLRIGQIATRNSRQKQREGITRRSYGYSNGRTNFFPPRNS